VRGRLRRLEDTNGESRADDKNDDTSEFPISFSRPIRKQHGSAHVGTLANADQEAEYTLQSSLTNTLTFFGSTRPSCAWNRRAVTNPDDPPANFDGKTFLLVCNSIRRSRHRVCGCQLAQGDTSAAGDLRAARRRRMDHARHSGGEAVGLPRPQSAKTVDPFSTSTRPPAARGPFVALPRTFFAGPIPITLQAEVTLDGASGGFHVDDQTQEPAFRVVRRWALALTCAGGRGGRLKDRWRRLPVRRASSPSWLEFPFLGLKIEKRTRTRCRSRSRTSTS